MEFSNLLKPEAIRIFSSVSSKKRLLHDIAGIAEACYQTDYSQTVEALIERESLDQLELEVVLRYLMLVWNN